MSAVDLKKVFRHLYQPSAKSVSVVDVPPLQFFMVDGQGNPNTAPAFGEAIGALYSLSYTLKFMLKGRPDTTDFTVMPLEALWWNTDSGALDPAGDPDRWYWTAMILQPDSVNADQVAEAREAASRKKPSPVLNLVRLERFHEGESVQIMYTGPYAAERPTIERLHAFVHEQGWQPAGKHHEIYLSDPNRTAPEKLKTVIRQPFRRA